MFQPKHQLKNQAANDRVSEIITQNIINKTHDLLLDMISWSYDNRECFGLGKKTAEDISRKCFLKALSELDGLTEAWNQLAIILVNANPNLEGRCNGSTLNAAFGSLFDKLCTGKYAEFKEEEIQILSAVMHIAVANGEELIGKERDEDIDDETDVLTPEDVFCILTATDYSDILELFDTPEERYEAAESLYYLGDIRYADDYWFGLKLVELEEDEEV